MAFEKVIIGPHTLYRGDCLEVLGTLSGVDACVSDPPYGIAKNYLKASATGEWSALYSEQIEWDDEAPIKAVMQSLALSGGIGIIWGGNYFPLPPMRGWLIWDKMQNHSSGHAELAWTSQDIPVRTFSYCRAQLASEGKEHPTQKPLSLMEWCLSFLPNSHLILDPFMGSGTTVIACHRMGKTGIGIERETKYFDIACKRLEAELNRFPMFEQPTVKQASLLEGVA